MDASTHVLPTAPASVLRRPLLSDLIEARLLFQFDSCVSKKMGLTALVGLSPSLSAGHALAS